MFTLRSERVPGGIIDFLPSAYDKLLENDETYGGIIQFCLLILYYQKILVNQKLHLKGLAKIIDLPFPEAARDKMDYQGFVFLLI